MSTADNLSRAMDRVRQVRTFIEAQGPRKLILIGSAIALMTYAAYSFFQSSDDSADRETKRKQEKSRDSRRDSNSRNQKKRPLTERKFFTEEEDSFDDLTTSNPHEKNISGIRGGKKRKNTFMSESDGPELRSLPSKDIDNKVKEEADCLYFAMMDKLKD
jgi:hypothetical protein